MSYIPMWALSTREQIESISFFFPSPIEHISLIFCKNVRAIYFGSQVFGTAPAKESSSLFSSWRSRLYLTYKYIWKSLGIAFALKLATFTLSYTAPLLGS